VILRRHTAPDRDVARRHGRVLAVFPVVSARVAATSVALFGIGLGWNFSYVAATAELAEDTNPAERGRVLGFAELLSGLLGAAAASSGGLALATAGLALAPVLWILWEVSRDTERGRPEPSGIVARFQSREPWRWPHGPNIRK
jgi:hypothetical protein